MCICHRSNSYTAFILTLLKTFLHAIHVKLVAAVKRGVILQKYSQSSGSVCRILSRYGLDMIQPIGSLSNFCNGTEQAANGCDLFLHTVLLTHTKYYKLGLTLTLKNYKLIGNVPR